MILDHRKTRPCKHRCHWYKNLDNDGWPEPNKATKKLFSSRLDNAVAAILKAEDEAIFQALLQAAGK